MSVARDTLPTWFMAISFSTAHTTAHLIIAPKPNPQKLLELRCSNYRHVRIIQGPQAQRGTVRAAGLCLIDASTGRRAKHAEARGERTLPMMAPACVFGMARRRETSGAEGSGLGSASAASRSLSQMNDMARKISSAVPVTLITLQAVKERVWVW